MKTLYDFILFDDDFKWRSFYQEKDELFALIEQKTDFSIKNEDGQSILHYIAQIGNDSSEETKNDMLKIIKYALECGCKFPEIGRAHV